MVSHLTAAPTVLSAQVPKDTTGLGHDSVETWGATSPGAGFEVARTSKGTLNISAYGLSKYLNHLPPHQSYEDHLGRVRAVDTRTFGFSACRYS